VLAVSILGPPDTRAEGILAARRPTRALAAAGISLLLFAGIAYGGWRLLHSPAGHQAASCASATPAAALPEVTVRVLNGTGRRGLARATADVLRQRGFRIAGVGNAARVAGRSQVRYGAGQALPGRLMALQLPSALVIADNRVTNEVDVILGGTFRRLRTPAEVAAATTKAKLTAPRPVASAPCR
jgi:LytR cell envelope-related transcriptional attenuator